MSKETQQKKTVARMLFIQGTPGKDIAEKLSVSQNTVTRWQKEGGWSQLRSASTVSRQELVNKILLAISSALDKANDSDGGGVSSVLVDQLCKLSATIEKLDKKNNVVTVIEVFTAFVKWLQVRMETDPELSPELLKAINKYQDLYVAERLSV